MLRYYIKRILKSKLYYICMLIAVGILVLGCINLLATAGTRIDGEKISVLECLVMTLDMGGFFGVIAPALTSITFLFFFTEDMEKRSVYYQLLRTDRKRFFGGQIVSSLISTIILVAIPLFVFCLVCLASGVVWEFDGKWFTLFEGIKTEAYYYNSNSWKMTLWYFVLVIMYCLPWALIGMVVSLFVKNRYLILASPFVIFMVWNYISQFVNSHIGSASWFNPMQPLLIWGILLEREWSLLLTFLYPVLYHVILLGGLSLMYCLCVRRRFHHEGL